MLASAMDAFVDLLYCPTCRLEEFAETPACVDGHGVECADRACLHCGTAYLFDPLLVAPVQLVARHAA